MKITPFHAAVGGVALCATIVAFVVRPPALAPHAQPTLSLDAIAPETAENAALRPAAAVRSTSSSALSASSNSVVVYVAGAVMRPGVYTLAGKSRVTDAIARAGGLNRDADAIAVNLAAPLDDGEEIAVPRVGETVSLPAGESESARATRSGHGHSSRRSRRHRHRQPRTDDGAAGETSAAASPVDINHADAQTLATLPGIGETLADRIVAFRELNGPFDSVDGLADVSGMTERRLEELAPLITARR